MANKYMSVDNLSELTFYEAIEYLSEGAQIECHIEDEDGVVIEYEKYSIFKDPEEAISIKEIIYGKWYVRNDSILGDDVTTIYFKGEF